MQLFAIVLGVLTAGTPAYSSAEPPSTGPSVRVSRCLVSLLEEAQVPAQEAGVLVALAAREGQHVAKGDLLGQIDPTQAEIDRRAAGFKLSVAQEKASNDINLRYSRAAADVAKAEYDAAITINRQSPRTVPEVEVNRLQLVWRKATLQIEQSQEDQKVYGLEAQVCQADLDAAQAQVARRQIRSPLDGVVVKCYRHAGEWVKPGDPAFHVLRMDRLRIEGFLNQSQYAPAEIDSRPVTVEVELSRGRRELFTGQIVFVSPLVQAGGEYRVWAEVANRQEGRHWLLRPGQLAEMTIHLGGKGPGAGGQGPEARDKVPAVPSRKHAAFTRSIPRVPGID
jgi:multidrug resistance efflux pump